MRRISPYYVVVAVAVVLGFTIGYVFPTFGLISTSDNHDFHSTNVAEGSILPSLVDEYDTSYEMFNDGRLGLVTVYEDLVDPENHCEFCLRIDYTSGPEGKAGFAIESKEPLNLAGAQRLVVFARSEFGGDKVQFFAAGTKTGDVLRDLSTSARWAAVSEEITLSNNWRKYEIDVLGGNLARVTYPLAIELPRNDERTKVIIYIHGMTFDSVGAEKPIPLKVINSP